MSFPTGNAMMKRKGPVIEPQVLGVFLEMTALLTTYIAC